MGVQNTVRLQMNGAVSFVDISRHVGKLVVSPAEHHYDDYILQLDGAPPPFSQECRSASQSCSSTALEQASCKRRQPTSPLATPFAGSNTMRFLSLGVRLRHRLRTTIAYVPQWTSWSDNACTADNYSGHATPSLGWMSLPCGCVSCDSGCTHWRTVINTQETGTVTAANGVCFARVSWEINFLLTFETAPFICKHPV